jgi:lipoprotein-anchoring transpeptidase ErfK/SrfK
MTNKTTLPWLGFFLLGLAAVAVVSILLIRAHWVSVERRAYEVDSALPDLKELKAKNRELTAQMRRNGPQGVFIIIDTGKNQLTLKKGDKVLREAVVSSGSGSVLEDPNGQRSWVFDTPRGVFAVKALIRDPYWVKPDWAFIEEDKPVPQRLDERIEGGVLGQYALSFGNGFFIHGTLYTRMLGRNVTHGCVRVGDADLEAVFRSSSVGTKIFIF